MSIDEVMDAAVDYSNASWLDQDKARDTLIAAIKQHVAEAVARERVTVLDEVLRGLRSERDTNQLRAIIAEVEAIRARADKETK